LEIVKLKNIITFAIIIRMLLFPLAFMSAIQLNHIAAAFVCNCGDGENRNTFCLKS